MRIRTICWFCTFFRLCFSIMWFFLKFHPPCLSGVYHIPFPRSFSMEIELNIGRYSFQSRVLHKNVYVFVFMFTCFRIPWSSILLILTSPNRIWCYLRKRQRRILMKWEYGNEENVVFFVEVALVRNLCIPIAGERFLVPKWNWFFTVLFFHIGLSENWDALISVHLWCKNRRKIIPL